MKSYQSLDRPSGILGVSFDDLSLFLSVVLVSLFSYNMLLKVVILPGKVLLLLIASFVVLFLLFRRLGKNKVAMYMHSRIAYRIAVPRQIIISSEDKIIPDGYIENKKAKSNIREN